MTTHQPIAGAALHHHEPVIAVPHCAIISPQLGIMVALWPAQHRAIGLNPERPQMTDLNTMTKEQLIAMVSQMQSNPRKMTVKVSEKGAISVYGFGRFPFTFYASQFDGLFTDANIATLRAFRTANADRLAVKA